MLGIQRSATGFDWRGYSTRQVSSASILNTSLCGISPGKIFTLQVDTLFDITESWRQYSMATGLSEEEKDAMQSNHNLLVKPLKTGLDDVKNWLYQKNFFTDTVRDYIEPGTTAQEKAEKLLNVVRDTDNPQGFMLFTQALEETNHRPTAQLLQEAVQEATQREVQLQRPEDGKFGFKFVPGSGIQRARFDGDNEYYITKLIPNRAAAQSGQLKEFDTIVCVNKKPIGKMSFDDVKQMLDNSMEIVLTIKRYRPTTVGTFEAFLAQQQRPESENC